MNENQRKWLLDLQSKGVKFEICSACDSGCWIRKGIWDFIFDSSFYRIPAQSVPDIPGWRELCREMQSKGVEFESNASYPNRWLTIKERVFPDNHWAFDGEIIHYRIPQQSLPEWREEMTEETKPDPREEIPHRELRIQWHEDMLHHLRTGEPMREWEYRLKNGDGEWRICHDPHFSEKYEYRRKPRTVTYWHCLVEGYGTNGVVYLIESTADALRKHVKSLGYEVVGQVTETTVEIED